MNEGAILVVAARDCAHLTERERTPWAEIALPLDWQFRPRAAVEEDEAWLQLIPYVVLRDERGAVWAYARRGGDGRLLGRRSVGVGGHIEESDRRPTLLDTARACARRELAEELRHLDERVAHYDRQIETIATSHPQAQALMTIPGLGAKGATAWVAAVGEDPRLFKNGRGLAAGLGLVPRPHSTGGRDRLLGISQRGEVYLRQWLIHGARAVRRWMTPPAAGRRG